MRKFLLSFGVILAITASLTVAPIQAFASSFVPEQYTPNYSMTSTNNTLSIKSVGIFSDYTVDGDWLLVAEVDNTITPYANNGTPGRYFVFNLIATDNTTIIAATPMLFWNDAPVSIYLSPSMVSGLTYGATYRIQVIGTYTLPASANYTLSASNWYGSDLRQLDDWVINTATSMDNYYGYTFGSTNDLLSYTSISKVTLSNTGGAYFSTAIPNLPAIRPNLFLLPASAPTYSPNTETNTYDSTNDWTLKVGSQITSDMAIVADMFGITSKQSAQLGLIAFLIIIFLLMLGSANTGVGLIVFAAPILIVFGYLGIISITVSLILAGGCLYLFVRRFWWSST